MPTKFNLSQYSDTKFGRLTIIKEFGYSKHRKLLVECLCDCNNSIVAVFSSIKNGNTKSCGCLQKERAAQSSYRHGYSYHPIYKCYHNMKRRVEDKNNPRYSNYGGRGIKICEQWSKSFESFYKWAFANGYKKNLTIDRIDNNGNYEPSNCRFITRSENNRNTRNVKVNYKISQEIKDKRRQGTPIKELQKQFNLSRSQINGIIHNRSWAQTNYQRTLLSVQNNQFTKW